MKKQTCAAADANTVSVAVLLFMFVAAYVGSADGAAETATAATSKKCTEAFTKVSSCLSFATGTAPVPSKECCDAATAMRNSDPECMCYVIQQVRKGDDQVKSLGIQYAKLLQLPTACNLKNSSVGDCPKLLHIPAGSPEAAIFSNTPTATAAVGGAKGTTSSPQPDKSNGYITRPYVINVANVVLVFVFLFVLKNRGSD